MKTLTKTLTIAAITLLIAFTPKNTSAQSYVNFQIFYDNLSPYGNWVDYPHYGYVWVPNVGPNFTPYLTNGHWVYTDYGWTWSSYYDWGWAPFHYGRWDYDNYYGWFWVPGDEWGPAWVVWSRAEGYYGWTPLKPGVSINVIHSKRFHVPHHHWIFVKDRDFEDEHIWHRHVHHRDNVRIIQNSTIIVNTYRDDHHHVTYYSGPEREDVQRRVGRTVRRMAVERNDRPTYRVEKEKVYIYRPEIKKDEPSGRRVSPRPVERWESPKAGKSQSRERVSNEQQHQNPPPTSSGRRQQVQEEKTTTKSQVKRESATERQEVKKQDNNQQQQSGNSNRRR